MKKSSLLKIMTAVTVCITLIMSLSGCAREESVPAAEDTEVSEEVSDTDEPVLLFDYYQAVTGTPEDQGYYELVIYRQPDGSVTLDRFIMDENTDEGETHDIFEAPEELAEKAQLFVEENNLAGWNRLPDFEVLDGILYVIRFKDGDDWCRVSSEKMPEDGEKIFLEARDILSAYLPE